MAWTTSTTIDYRSLLSPWNVYSKPELSKIPATHPGVLELDRLVFDETIVVHIFIGLVRFKAGPDSIQETEIFIKL